MQIKNCYLVPKSEIKDLSIEEIKEKLWDSENEEIEEVYIEFEKLDVVILYS